MAYLLVEVESGGYTTGLQHVVLTLGALASSGYNSIEVMTDPGMGFQTRPLNPLGSYALRTAGLI